MEGDNRQTYTQTGSEYYPPVNTEPTPSEFCIHCGTAVAPGTVYCPNCGQPVSAATPYSEAPGYGMPEAPKKKKGKTIGIIAAVVAVVILLVILFSGGGGSKYDSYLVGSWTLSATYEDGDIESAKGLATAVFRSDHTGTIRIGEKTWSVEWEFDQVDEDGWYDFDLSLNGESATTASIPGDNTDNLYYPLVEMIMIFEKD